MNINTIPLSARYDENARNKGVPQEWIDEGLSFVTKSIKGRGPTGSETWFYLAIPSTVLETLPTISAGQADNLKIDRDGIRYFVSRMTWEDGEQYRCSIEVYRDRVRSSRWESLHSYEAIEAPKDAERCGRCGKAESPAFLAYKDGNPVHVSREDCNESNPTLN